MSTVGAEWARDHDVNCADTSGHFTSVAAWPKSQKPGHPYCVTRRLSLFYQNAAPIRLLLPFVDQHNIPAYQPSETTTSNTALHLHSQLATSRLQTPPNYILTIERSTERLLDPMANTMTPAAPTSLSKVFGTPELAELVLSKLSLIDLAAARGTITDLNTSIADPQTKTLKQALFLIPKAATEYAIWKRHQELQDPWQPHISKEAESFRDRPITVVNAILERFRVEKPTSTHRLEGWQDVEMYFNADALLDSVKDGSVWDKTLLTKTGQMDVELDVVVDHEWKDHLPEGYDDEWGCVPGEDFDGDEFDGDEFDGDEFDDGQEDEEFEDHDGETTEESDEELDDVPEDDPDTYPEEKEHLGSKVTAADEDVGVTIADLKRAIRTLRATKYKGPWVEGHHARLTIRGCVVEGARCVNDARAWAAGTFKARPYPNWRQLSDEE